MENKQQKLLIALAKKLKSQKKDRKIVIASLQSAKILTQNENFTGHLRHLDKVFAVSE